jgi:holo-[acyl-carrier protein] synthase
MVKGIGVDIIEVVRIKQSIQKYEERFLRRIFTAEERDYCLDKSKPEIHFAARFAAKEAVVKALGTGLRNMKWVDIEVVNNELGKPEIRLHNQAAIQTQKLEVAEVLISLSHTENYAVAQALAL